MRKPLNEISYICPYFSNDKGNGRVYCECATFKFPDAVARREFCYKFCGHPTDYKNCPIYEVMERYYYERKYGENGEQSGDEHI